MLHAGGYTQACRRPGWSAGTRVRLRVRVRCNDDIVDDGFCAHERVTSGRRETHPVSSVSPVKRFWWETAAWSFQQGRSVSRDRLAAHAGPSQCPKSCPGSCACLALVACQCVVCSMMNQGRTYTALSCTMGDRRRLLCSEPTLSLSASAVGDGVACFAELSALHSR